MKRYFRRRTLLQSPAKSDKCKSNFGSYSHESVFSKSLSVFKPESGRIPNIIFTQYIPELLELHKFEISFKDHVILENYVFNR